MMTDELHDDNFTEENAGLKLSLRLLEGMMHETQRVSDMVRDDYKFRAELAETALSEMLIDLYDALEEVPRSSEAAQWIRAAISKGLDAENKRYGRK